MNKKKSIFKSLIYIFISLFIIGIIIILYFLSTFRLSDEIPMKEMKRISSPDSLVDAIIVEHLGNATTSNGLNVYLVPKGENFIKGFEQLIADHTYNFNINWKENKFLLVEYDQARIFKFSNFWNSDKVDNWEYVVEVRLIPLVDSTSLNLSDRGN